MLNSDDTCPGADPAPRPPKDLAPPDACDCHAHIFGPVDQYPYSDTRKYTPPEATLEAYRHMLATLGLSRGVIVQPSVYGLDNRATLDAIKAGAGKFRGVAVIDPTKTSDGELDHMHHIGIRGVRINQAYDQTLDMAYLHKVVEKIQRLNWHLQLFVNLNRFPDFRRQLATLPVAVVIDHMGFMGTETKVSNQSFQDLLALLGTGKCWVKLSGAYRLSAQRDLPYSDVAPFAEALANANPDRCVWATDWPHPHLNMPAPNDGDLLDLLSKWVPDAKARHRILVDNPANLYDFPAIG